VENGTVVLESARSSRYSNRLRQRAAPISLGLLMVSTVALVAGVVAILLTALALWRVSRRLLTAGHLDDISVSRQWLLQHQDER